CAPVYRRKPAVASSWTKHPTVVIPSEATDPGFFRWTANTQIPRRFAFRNDGKLPLLNSRLKGSFEKPSLTDRLMIRRSRLLVGFMLIIVRYYYSFCLCRRSSCPDSQFPWRFLCRSWPHLFRRRLRRPCQRRRHLCRDRSRLCQGAG